MDLCAYLVSDPQAAIAFHRDVLGMTPTAVDDGGRGAEFTLGDGSTFGVWKPEKGGSGFRTASRSRRGRDQASRQPTAASRV
ncbi:MAG: VOC family protein [Candidatus Cybelea sp.]